MTERGSATIQEILSQPVVWEIGLQKFFSQVESLVKFFDEEAFERVVFTGCGSTYYLSLSAASVFQESTKIPTVAKPASELLLFPNLVYLPGANTLLVAVSRSGETSETIHAVRKYRDMSTGKVLVITCDSGSTLAALADYLIAVDDAQETSVAQTRSFATMMVIAEALAACVGGNDISLLNQLPGRVQKLFDQFQSISKMIGEDLSIDQFFFLGNGNLYGIACEAMLKMKEMTISHSEAYHILEFRHGPMSMVNARSLVVGMLSEEAKKPELEVLEHMHQLGGKILMMGFDLPSESKFPSIRINLGKPLPDWMSPVLYLPVLQLVAYFRSMAKGLNPDRPNNLDAVVKLTTI